MATSFTESIRLLNGNTKECIQKESYRQVLVNVKQSLKQSQCSMRLWDVKAPTFSRHRTLRARRDCRSYAPAALYPHEDSWYFLLHAQSTTGP
jgi:hypothetical protein